MNDIIDKFIDHMRTHGINPSSPIIPDGTLRRAHVEGDRTGTLNLAYTFHSDGIPAGWFLHFRTGATGTWAFDGKKEPMTAAIRQQIQRAKVKRQLEQAEAHNKATDKARWLWKQSTPITKQSEHPYLVKKCIKPHGARLSRDALVIPIQDETGTIVNLQFIQPEGQKRFLSGGRKKGCYSYIGDPTETILICEGFATGASLYEATGHYVVAALDAGNLKPVAEIIRKQYPAAEIIIAGDNDEVGRKSANDAALACGGKVFIPPVLGMDWNDYINQGGAV